MVKIGDVCSLMTGGTPKTTISEYYENGTVPWIVSGDIHKSEIFDCDKKITELAVENSNARYLPKDSVLIALNGQGKTRGTVALLRASNATCNQSIVSINPNDQSELLSDYLFYFLKSQYRQIRNITGDKDRAGLNMPLIRSIEIPLPPLDEQKRIAAILDKADAIRRKRQQAIQLADDFLRSVFLDMFGDPVTNPKGWEVKKLGELTTIRRGASPRPIAKFMGGEVPWIKIGDGSKGDQVYLNSTKEHVTQEGASKSVFLAKGSLIFANCGVSLGFARILNIAGCIHDGWLSIENIDKGLNKIFILKWINQLTLYFRRIAPDGTQPNLNSGIMRDQEIILPPIEIQNKFEDVLLKHEGALAKLNDGLVSANEAFNSLSQKAFAGDL